MSERSYGGSFRCPRCRGPTGVLDSRGAKSSPSTMRRRRLCNQCNHRFTTIEVVQETFDRLNSIDEVISELRTIKKRIDKVISGGKAVQS